MSRVLVDTSIWVDYFRKGDSCPDTPLLGRLLKDGLVCVNGLIRAELLSGTASRREFDALETGLSALTFLDDPPGQWEEVAQARFRLARKGFSASIADLLVAVCAARHQKALWTRDRAFEKIRGAVDFKALTP